MNPIRCCKRSTGWLLLWAALTAARLAAQVPGTASSAGVWQDLQKLKVLGSALCVAAHPDDENNQLIAYLAAGEQYRTGYLSLTRGDGGQNLLGPELREGLGVIRTQELLQARRLDGGIQFFSRANDFGFSKNPQETFTIWDKEQLLADVVWIIRQFRPDVIITRFSPDQPAPTHGHHTASALLAEAAFEAAADPKRFPEQLPSVSPWQAKRLVWNAEEGAFNDPADFARRTRGWLAVDIGGYSPVLGKSSGELAAESRSMHKSQAMGEPGMRGSAMAYFQHTKGDKAAQHLFDGINTTWTRIPGGEKVEMWIDQALAAYHPARPADVVSALVGALRAIDQLPDGYWLRVKREEIRETIRKALGLHLEAVALAATAVPGGQTTLQLQVVNRSGVPVTLQKMRIPFAEKDSTLGVPLPANQLLQWLTTAVVPAHTPYSQPYWLRKPGTPGQFVVDQPAEVGLPENPPLAVDLAFSVLGFPLAFTVPVQHKVLDPVAGDVFQPFAVTPPVFVNLPQQVFVFADARAKPVTVTVKAGRDEVTGTVTLQLPPGWRADPAAVSFHLPVQEAEREVTFAVHPPEAPQETTLRAVVTVDGNSYHQGLQVIRYPHIPAQVLFPEASARAVKLDLSRKGERIGYVVGAGDQLPICLREIGYQVTLLQEDQLRQPLAQYDAIILGIRAYNKLERLRLCQNHLLEYVQRGGNLIVQYNTDYGLLTPDLGPYPITLSAHRVAVENAPVRFLQPTHPVLHAPNRITQRDFEGWVQERGLNFPQKWHPTYQTVLATHDPGETPLHGGLLIAPCGKGNFIYTSFSWFRQLPAGVPGAYRLFTNLISLGR